MWNGVVPRLFGTDHKLCSSGSNRESAQIDTPEKITNCEDSIKLNDKQLIVILNIPHANMYCQIDR